MSSYNFWDNLFLRSWSCMVCHTLFKFVNKLNKARAFQDGKWAHVLAIKTPIALVILVHLVGVRVTLLLIVNATCSCNCPVSPVLVLN